MLHAASLIHASGVFVLPFWLRGGRTVILPGFEPQAFLAAIERERATAINLVPTMLQMLVETPAMASCRVDALRYVIYGASPMPRSVIERAMAVWGRHRFWQYYGQTEVPLCLAVLRPEDHHGDRLGACGQPALEVEVRLLDEAGQDVLPGQPGEIAVRGPSAVAGYHDAPELTAQTFRADGWVLTRDVGVFDAHGFLFLKDRTSDMIVSGGYNVYPAEVENAISALVEVAEVAVVGVPDERWGEAVKAVVVVRPGQELSEDAVVAACTDRLAAYKKPRSVDFTRELPKTGSGKIMRRRVRDKYWDGRERSVGG
jgi:fatty-acyl-CoA synthase